MSSDVTQRRVVITGMGVVSPVGNDVETTWSNLVAGKSGGGPITRFDATDDFACRIGCEVKGFDPLDYMDKRDVKRHDPVSQFAIAASAQALASAGYGSDFVSEGVLRGARLDGW